MYMDTKNKKQAFGVVTWLICAVIFFMIAEIYLSARYIQVSDFDPCNPMRESDNITPTWGAYTSLTRELDPKHPVLEHIEENGARASRADYDRPCKYRVLFLGDYETYGEGVKDEDTYVWKLGERFPKVNFDNYGSRGTCTYHCLLRMQSILPIIKPKYDLVIYAASAIHVHSNGFSGRLLNLNNIDDGSYKSLLSFLLNENGWVDYRGVTIDDNGDLVQAKYQWFGDKYFRTLWLLKRYCVWRDMLKRADVFEGDSDLRRDVYWHLIGMMNDYAHDQGSDFDVFCLTDKYNPDLEYPSEEELQRWSKGGNVSKVLGDHEIKYYFAGDGREGHEDGPEYHNGGVMRWHPNSKVHASWAKHIGDQLEKLLPADCVKP